LHRDFTGRVARPYLTRGNIAENQTSCPDKGMFADPDSAEDGDTGTDGGTSADDCADYLPVSISDLVAAFIRCTWISIVDKGDIVPDKDIVFDNHAFTNKRVTRYFTVSAYFRVLLDFHKCPYFRALTDDAAIEVHKAVDEDVFAQPDIVRNSAVIHSSDANGNAFAVQPQRHVRCF
jgi:hypothetical protein